MNGSGGGLQVSVGGTPAPGLVIGATAVIESTEALSTGSARYSSADFAGADELAITEGLTLFGLGPFVDWYFDPKGGLHAQAAVLLAGAASGDIEVDGKTVIDQNDSGGGGLGVFAGVGYDWWVADQWSLGVLGRLGFAGVSSQKGSSPTVDHRVLMAPGLQLTATFH